MREAGVGDGREGAKKMEVSSALSSRLNSASEMEGGGGEGK